MQLKHHSKLNTGLCKGHFSPKSGQRMMVFYKIKKTLKYYVLNIYIKTNSSLDTATVTGPFFPSHLLLVPGSFPGWT